MPFDSENYSFATIPNAFRQCAISLRRIHSALLKYFLKKLPDLKYNLCLLKAGLFSSLIHVKANLFYDPRAISGDLCGKPFTGQVIGPLG